jgi:hypothetical protein
LLSGQGPALPICPGLFQGLPGCGPRGDAEPPPAKRANSAGAAPAAVSTCPEPALVAGRLTRIGVLAGAGAGQDCGGGNYD